MIRRGLRRWLLLAFPAAAAGAQSTGQDARTGVERSARAQDAGVTFGEFYRMVREYHPVVRQARLTVETSDAEVRGAFGAFEPVFSASWDSKTLGGKRYWDEYSYKLILPTPIGADVKLGYERASGNNLNPESVIPSGGLFSAGVSIPFGQRMWTDERRNAVTVARAARDGAEAEQRAVTNKLLLTAAKDWAGWYESERRAEIANDGVRLAEFRLEAVRRRVRAGDASALDTVEAAVELDRRTVTRLEAAATAYSARLTATAHLWDARGAPVDLSAEARPAVDGGACCVTDTLTVERALALAEREHPELGKLTAKVRQSAAARTLAAQGVLPLVSLDAAALGAGSASALSYSSSDAKAGLSAKLSPFLVKDRAKLAAATAKLDRDRLEVDRMRREIALDIRDALNQQRAIAQQLERQSRIVKQATLLRDGEQRRYEIGESSLLLVNLRERAVLDERLKLAALEGKQVATRAALVVAIGDPSVFVP